MWQTGSGTQTNMNMNEVLANRASRAAGRRAWAQARRVHPNDDVNLRPVVERRVPDGDARRGRCRPSTTTCCLRCAALRDTLAAKSAAFADIVKIGRTHLQDATPLTLGQEISGWVAQLDHGDPAICGAAWRTLHELALGGTAVGTGLNTHPEFGERVAAELAARDRPAVRAARRTSSRRSPRTTRWCTRTAP